MVHMGGESWCAIKDLQAPFPDLKTGHVDHLLSYIYQRIIYWIIYWTIFLENVMYFSIF